MFLMTGARGWTIGALNLNYLLLLICTISVSICIYLPRVVFSLCFFFQMKLSLQKCPAVPLHLSLSPSWTFLYSHVFLRSTCQKVTYHFRYLTLYILLPCHLVNYQVMNLIYFLFSSMCPFLLSPTSSVPSQRSFNVQ